MGRLRVQAAAVNARRAWMGKQLRDWHFLANSIDLTKRVLITFLWRVAGRLKSDHFREAPRILRESL
jgi:hypothetical protein